MNEFQEKVFGIIKWYHNFCVENSLTYYMLGGTMLGAIRHKGFIPWDDDADFGMPRDDYERFIKLTKDLKNNFFAVESYFNNNDDFPYPFVKVYDKRTTLVEDLRYPVTRGIYIDVFPLDECGKKNSALVNNLFFEINLYNLKICNRKKKRAFYKRLMINFYQMLHQKKTNHYKLCERLNNKAKKIGKKNKGYFANFFGAWAKKEIISKNIFGEPTRYRFEQIELFGPENYDGYLKSLYGNYMELPPPEKRGNHHTFLALSLTEGYYKK